MSGDEIIRKFTQIAKLGGRPGRRAAMAAMWVGILAAPAIAQGPAPEVANLEKKAASEAAGRDFADAAGDLRAAIVLAPKDAGLRVRLGQALAAERQYPEAIASYQQALALAPHDLAGQMGLASAYRAVHNYDQARRELEAAHREHPREAGPLRDLGDLEIELQAYDAAIARLKAALSLAPNDVESRERLAVSYRSKGDSARALEQIAIVLKNDPKNALGYFTRAQIYSDRNQDSLALADAEKVVKLQPRNRRGRALLGKILLRLADNKGTAGARQQCEHAVDILQPIASGEGADSESLFLLSRAYRCAGDDANADKTNEAFEASSKSDRTLKENQTQAKHLVQQANDLAMKNDFAGSVDLLNQAIAIDPTYGAAYSQMAKLYYSNGDIEKASDAIAEALKRDPYQPDFLFVSGKILEKQGDLDGAMTAFERTVDVNPKEADAYFEMGEIFRARGDQQKAIAEYEKACALSPEDSDYRRTLEELRDPK
jgi:tetratricopeptide (TPR) repeat protein